MREEVKSSGTVDPSPIVRSSSPPATPAASSAAASSPAVPANVGSIDWFGSAQGSKPGSLSGIGPQPPKASLSRNVSSNRGSSQPSCRPWERGDLLRRLATFKPSNWSGKPKGASSLACARRGWVNVDTDKIECEACGARLTFAALTSSIQDGADSAGEAFSGQIDAAHRAACPWKGNCCADSLVQFPPTPPSALIGGYKDRCDALLQFPSLPLVALSAVDTMKLSRSAQIDRFLSQSQALYSGGLGFKADSMPVSEFSREDIPCSHSNGLKLISLCGWEPRWMPNLQDFEEHSAQSTKNACSFGPTKDDLHHSRFLELSKNAFSTPAMKDRGEKGKSVQESCSNMRSPLLDCSLCGVTVRIWDFLTVSRPSRFGLYNVGMQESSKKPVLARGACSASGINEWVTGKEPMEGRDEATNDEGKSQSNAGMDLNLTMGGGLPSTMSVLPIVSENVNVGAMGRDLIIGQPSGSEVGDRAASYESRGLSTRKRSAEEGGSTIDRPQDRVQRADSVEGSVIDRDVNEVDDDSQVSDCPSKRARGLDIFDTYHSSRRVDSSGAGPSRNLGFEIDIDVNRVDPLKEGSDVAVGHPSTRDSARASSVIAMDTICHSDDDDSMESVENYPGDLQDVPSSSNHRNLDMNDALEPNISIQAQQSTCLAPAAGSVARDMGGSSTNEEEILNAETTTAHARDRFSLGISGGSVGMVASHEAEIHGVDLSVHRTDSVIGDVEPIAEVTENLGQTGESAPGPGIMDEFVPEEMGREDRQGDNSQDLMSRSVGRDDSGSKVYGSTKADSTESGKKATHNVGYDSSAHPSLSCNAVISCGYDLSKEEVTQNGKASLTTLPGPDYATVNGLGPANGENDYEAEAKEFDPIKHHNTYCPWVNGNVAAAGCSINGGSTLSTSDALCGWQLTLDALNDFESIGYDLNQTMESESAASLYKDDITPSKKLLTRRSMSKNKGKC